MLFIFSTNVIFYDLADHVNRLSKNVILIDFRETVLLLYIFMHQKRKHMKFRKVVEIYEQQIMKMTPHLCH
jgi:hypothetical protein